MKCLLSFRGQPTLKPFPCRIFLEALKFCLQVDSSLNPISNETYHFCSFIFIIRKIYIELNNKNVRFEKLLFLSAQSYPHNWR